MSLLDTPVRLDRDAERLYFFDGAVSVDLNGNEEKRKVVLEFLPQAQEMARFELADTAGHKGLDGGSCLCGRCEVLRKAGLR